MEDAQFLDLAQRLGMALAIGFLVGVERGWRHRDAPEGARAAGLRTHTVIGMSGGLMAALLPAIGALAFAVLSLAFLAAIIVFKVRESMADNDLSVTGTIAALLVFALGAYAMVGDLRIAAGVGVALTALLAFKDALHAWLDKLTWPELRSALLILAASAIALPLLPDRAVDHWGLVNPREIWLLTILVAGASFAGYVAVRFFGGQLGVLAGAAAGALVSSTVVTVELGRQVRKGETPAPLAAAAASLAAAVSLTRLAILLAIAAPVLVGHVGPALGAAALVMALLALLGLRSAANAKSGGVKSDMRSPLDLMSVVQFAALLAATMIVGRVASNAFGEAGLLGFSAVAGIADVDAASLSAAAMVREGLDPATGALAAAVAALVNTFSKAVLALVTGGVGYAARYGLAAVLAAAAGAGGWLLAGAI